MARKESLLTDYRRSCTTATTLTCRPSNFKTSFRLFYFNPFIRPGGYPSLSLYILSFLNRTKLKLFTYFPSRETFIGLVVLTSFSTKFHFSVQCFFFLTTFLSFLSFLLLFFYFYLFFKKIIARYLY